VGFGLDSVIEVVSGAGLLWRLHHDLDPTRRERVEQATVKIVGGCLIALAAYIVWESGPTLIHHDAPERSIVGIVVAAAAIVVMPPLARANRRVAGALGSGAMHADSRQTDFCAYLSAILLGGLLLNAVASWRWADPVAGLVMAPIIAREGINALKGESCGDSCSCR
jgi:divalent metal cation (Fe/Co/Zn/Cd) transporter